MTSEPSTATTNVTEAMRAAIGGLIARRVSYPITATDIRRWALATYYPDEPPPMYWDEEYAATTVHRGLVAPLELNPFAWLAAEPRGLVRQGGAINPDFIENSLGVAGPGLKFMLNGGMETTYGVRMRAGDAITSMRRLAGYSEREGRLGLMLFTISEDTWTNQRGEVVKTHRDTLIRYGRPE
jgi:hypothetical protein